MKNILRKKSLRNSSLIKTRVQRSAAKLDLRRKCVQHPEVQSEAPELQSAETRVQRIRQLAEKLDLSRNVSAS